MDGLWNWLESLGTGIVRGKPGTYTQEAWPPVFRGKIVCLRRRECSQAKHTQRPDHRLALIMSSAVVQASLTHSKSATRTLCE